jgi:hypothetical protein
MSDKVLERTSRIHQALSDLGRISDPMTAFTLSQILIDVNAIDTICQKAQDPGPGLAAIQILTTEELQAALAPDPAPSLPRPRKALPGKGKTV